MLSVVFSKKFKEILLSNNVKTIHFKLTEFLHSSTKDSIALLYELTRETINKQFSLENYLALIDIISKENPDFLSKNLLEIIWLCGFASEIKNGITEDQETAKIYSNIVNNLIKKKILNQHSLIEKLEESSLFDAGLIQDKKTFRTKYNRVNTKITFEQQKYNLLREESEGFSKLIFLLFEVKLTEQNLKTYIDKILCLIGFFDLDPNRVLDIVLSAYVKDPFNIIYLEIIKSLSMRSLAHVLGFKLAAQQKDANVDSSIYIISAQIIKHELVELEDILIHLSPSEKEMEEAYTQNIASTQAFYQTLHSRVNKELSMVSNNTAYNKNSDYSDNVNAEPNLIVTANYFVNFNDILAEVYKTTEKYQYYRLFEGFVRVKSWKYCEIMYNLMENYYDPLLCKSLIDAMCDALAWMIEPIYKNLSFANFFHENKKIADKDFLSFLPPLNSHEFLQATTPEDFINEVPKLLKYLQLALSSDQILFTKILKLIKTHGTDLFRTSEAVIIDLIKKIFLPSISLIDPTPALVIEFWNVLSNLVYTKRYKIYNYCINNMYNTHPALFIKYGVVTKETAKWQKTLSKENQRQHGRTLAIITNSNPIIFFDSVIRLLTSYDNQINIFMQTLSFASYFSYDVITFIICKILGDPNREKLNVVNGDIASWFKYFSYFVGNFFKKNHFAEFSGIIYYLGGMLKKSEKFVELYVLKEILEKMTGIILMEDMNDTQIQSCSGGIFLYLESNDLIKEYKYLKKPILALLKFFVQNSNAMMPNSGLINGNGLVESEELSFTSVLLILLSIRRQNIIFTAGYLQPKLIGYLYDLIHNIFIQVIQFLSFHNERDAYQKLLPCIPLDKYVLSYNCEPEVIFFMIRNGLKPLYELNEQEYDQNVINFTKTLDTYQAINKKIFDDEFDSMYLEKTAFIDGMYRNIWKYVSPELYFIFSALQLKDIYVPVALYEKEIDNNVKERDRMMGDTKNASDGKCKKEIDKINNNLENLIKELRASKKNCEMMAKFIGDKKNLLVKEVHRDDRREIFRCIFEYCLYPRLIFSKVEALYAAKMLVMLINLRVQNINIFDIMQKMIKFLLPCILCVTEFEAQNIGVFLLEILKVLKYWQDEKIWEEECVPNSSFSKNFDSSAAVELKDFKKVIVCLLSKMNTTFQNIFSGDDYMSCRNALIVLSSLYTVYPPTKEISMELQNAITGALEKFAGYDDLQMMMKRYRDIITLKINTLPTELEITGEKSDLVVNMNNMNGNSNNIGNSNDKVNNIQGEKKKKRERSKEREKSKNRDRSKEKEKDRDRDRNDKDNRKAQESSRTPDINKKRSPEDNYRNSKKNKTK